MATPVFRILILTFVLLLGACAGRDFERPSGDTLILGTTSEEQIRERFGKPYSEGMRTVNGAHLKTLSYAYAAAGGEAAFEGVTPARGMNFYFQDGKLVGHEFMSSFKSDSTHFDIGAAQKVSRGETRAAVENRLGRAGGHSIYPMINVKDAKGDVYMYVQVKGFTIDQRSAVVVYDKAGRVQDVIISTAGPGK